MLKFSQAYDLPCLLIRLQGIERIMPAEGLPSGPCAVGSLSVWGEGRAWVN